MTGDGQPKRLLVLDISYTLEAIRDNKLEASVTCRDLGGYFDHVWTVHPFASLLTTPKWSPKFGGPVETQLTSRHTFIEGKVGRYAGLAGIAPLNFLLAQVGVLLYLLRLIRENQISAIRAGDPLVMGFYGWLVSRLSGIPLLVRVGGNYERVRQETGRAIMPRLLRSTRVEKLLEEFVLSRADLVAAVNDDNKRYVLAMGTPPERATVFRYGNLVDPIHFTSIASRAPADELLAALGLNGRRFLLSLSRLEPIKMVDHTIHTLATVIAQGSDVALVLVGGGSQRDALGALADSLGIGDRVIFAGERNQDWLSRVIPRASVVLSPLTGRALSETSLGGAPTVAYDLDWQGELIKSGETGELVTARDHAAMANAALRLLGDKPYAAALGARLRAAALEMMDQARLDAHERAEYDRILAAYPRR